MIRAGARILLEVKGLRAKVAGVEILKGIDLTVRAGEVHAVMGPNGSGKSTFAKALAGHPAYAISGGTAAYDGSDLFALAPEQRARAGLFLGFQYPVEIPGVSNSAFLRLALNTRRAIENGKDKGIPLPEFRDLLKAKMDLLKVPHDFAGRYLNEGFSGGEKKRAEILQLATLEPEIAILDETDSGLDIDAVRIVAAGVNALVGEKLGVLIITHYQRILNYIRPDFVHIMLDGTIVESGGPELAGHLEAVGYEGMQAG